MLGIGFGGGGFGGGGLEMGGQGEVAEDFLKAVHLQAVDFELGVEDFLDFVAMERGFIFGVLAGDFHGQAIHFHGDDAFVMVGAAEMGEFTGNFEEGLAALGVGGGGLGIIRLAMIAIKH